MLNGNNAYKWDFDVYRNRCTDWVDTLDFHTCVETLEDILGGHVSWCAGGPVWVIGGHEQVGCFVVSSSAQPGLCAGSLPFTHL